jgi:succinate dehydrogenase hydrophobic anchor subunit
MGIRNTTLWTWHLGAGLVLIILLGLHMFGMHLNDVLQLADPDPVSWESVAGRAVEISQVLFYILFLGFALYHGLYGLRNVLLELNLSPGMTGFVNTLLLVVGLVLFAFGTWAAIAAKSTAMAAM